MQEIITSHWVPSVEQSDNKKLNIRIFNMDVAGFQLEVHYYPTLIEMAFLTVKTSRKYNPVNIQFNPERTLTTQTFKLKN